MEEETIVSSSTSNTTNSSTTSGNNIASRGSMRDMTREELKNENYHILHSIPSKIFYAKYKNSMPSLMVDEINHFYSDEVDELKEMNSNIIEQKIRTESIDREAVVKSLREARDRKKVRISEARQHFHDTLLGDKHQLELAERKAEIVPSVLTSAQKLIDISNNISLSEIAVCTTMISPVRQVNEYSRSNIQKKKLYVANMNDKEKFHYYNKDADVKQHINYQIAYRLFAFHLRNWSLQRLKDVYKKPRFNTCDEMSIFGIDLGPLPYDIEYNEKMLWLYQMPDFYYNSDVANIVREKKGYIPTHFDLSHALMMGAPSVFVLTYRLIEDLNPDESVPMWKVFVQMNLMTSSVFAHRSHCHRGFMDILSFLESLGNDELNDFAIFLAYFYRADADLFVMLFLYDSLNPDELELLKKYGPLKGDIDTTNMKCRALLPLMISWADWMTNEFAKFDSISNLTKGSSLPIETSVHYKFLCLIYGDRILDPGTWFYNYVYRFIMAMPPSRTILEFSRTARGGLSPRNRPKEPRSINQLITGSTKPEEDIIDTERQTRYKVYRQIGANYNHVMNSVPKLPVCPGSIPNLSYNIDVDITSRMGDSVFNRLSTSDDPFQKPFSMANRIPAIRIFHSMMKEKNEIPLFNLVEPAEWNRRMYHRPFELYCPVWHDLLASINDLNLQQIVASSSSSSSSARRYATENHLISFDIVMSRNALINYDSVDISKMETAYRIRTFDDENNQHSLGIHFNIPSLPETAEHLRNNGINMVDYIIEQEQQESTDRWADRAQESMRAFVGEENIEEKINTELAPVVAEESDTKLIENAVEMTDTKMADAETEETQEESKVVSKKKKKKKERIKNSPSLIMNDDVNTVNIREDLTDQNKDKRNIDRIAFGNVKKETGNEDCIII